jgi:tetratricopeptide (TPR) repeat protein
MSSPEHGAGFERETAIRDDDIRSALKRVLASEEFASSPRLQRFLEYIVTETLGGRSSQIKGKTIAADVYGRNLADGDSGHNIVRVEARRLRRLLAEHYDGSGQDATVRIHIDPGGYTPRFEMTDQPDRMGIPEIERAPGAPAWWRSRQALFAFVAVPVLLAAGIVAMDRFESVDIGLATKGNAIRGALRERSMEALQSANLAAEARGMLFPLFDTKRQELALEMFRHAISLDPGLSDGYAGAAQVLATLSLVTIDEVQAATYGAKSLEMATKALDLAPSGAWAHAAFAWAHAVGGDHKIAMRHASIASDLAPEDGHVLDLVGITAIVAGDPEMAAVVSDPERPRSGQGRFGARNIWGVSQYMLGDYAAAIGAFRSAPEAGAPVSAPSLIFLAVAYDHIGEEAEARRLVQELTTTWPDFPTELLVRRIFHDDTVRTHDILERLEKKGLESLKK